MRALVAFDKFKDALTAAEACAITADALKRKHPDWMIEIAPLADGGDGFRDILTTAAGGEFRSVHSVGPRYAPVETSFGLVDSRTLSPAACRAIGAEVDARNEKIAIVEMATVSGLAMLKPAERDPMLTTTVGCGQIMQDAIRAGADRILLGIGGSATNDLGLGALQALGLRFVGVDGSDVSQPTPINWGKIANIVGSIPRAFPRVSIACDVANPLLGPNGAAATYGPQKGLKTEDLQPLEKEAGRMAKLLCRHFGCPADEAITRPGAGAAGGIGFGLSVALGAQFVPGANLVAAWLDLERKIAASDIVITGEGRFDRTSLDGKGPSYVIERALAGGRRVVVFAGCISDNLTEPEGGRVRLKSVELNAITPDGTPLPQALCRASEYLAASVSAKL